VAVVLTLLILVTSLVPAAPIRDAVLRTPAADARLERSIGYVVLGPLSSMFDAMTLFTVGQIIGFTLWAMALYVIVRLIRRRFTPVPPLREAVRAVLAFVGLLIVYVAAIVLPRPMARLVIARTDVIAVDFHSHTEHSHDGRPGWSVEDVRNWHAAAGYDVAYITDHRTLEGAEEAVRSDPPMAGLGTILLPGLEAYYHGEHVNILNAGLRYRGLTTADFKEVDERALIFTSMIPNAEPVLIETLPGKLANMTPATGPRTAGVRAIEIVDGSPRGMSQTKREHARIVHLADSLDLALVAGTDNHGWGRTAPGWTLLRIDNWRGYAPDSLAEQIERVIRLSGAEGTRVVERTTAPATQLGVALTLPLVFWNVGRTISTGERIAWLGWIWIIWALWRFVPGRSRRRSGRQASR
jgi:hypothetical protein